MLPNVVPLWEVMVAAMKLGAVVIPASTLLPAEDVEDRVARGEVRAVVALSDLADRFAGVPASVLRIAVGGAVDGWPRSPTPTARRPSFAPDGPTRGDRPAAPLLHERHDAPAEARRAHARELPHRPPDDDVLDRPAARRRAPQRLLPGLGQARVVVRLRAVERRGHRVPARPAALPRARPAGGRRAPRRDDALRAADGLADAGAGGPDGVRRRAARGGRRRRAAQPRGHRAGARPPGA